MLELELTLNVQSREKSVKLHFAKDNNKKIKNDRLIMTSEDITIQKRNFGILNIPDLAPPKPM